MALAARVVEHRALQYRRTFRASVFSSFVSPVLFLAAMGLGLGSYIDGGGNDAALDGVTYLQFLGPGLLAATVMQTAAFEATFPIMGGLVWSRVFHGMYATPISPRDVVLGNLAWIALRVLLVSSIFTLVLILFGTALSPLIVLAIPAGVLTGLAFAAPIAAFSATQRTVEKFNAVFRFGITPLFILSGTFFPISTLPAPLPTLAWLSPLWHGVDLARGLALGYAAEEPLVMVAHVVVLSGLTLAGVVWGVRTFTRRLVLG
jgi:lipooligosaccharide transport system permease protein